MRWLLPAIGIMNALLLFFGIARMRRMRFLKEHCIGFACILGVWAFTFVPFSDIFLKLRYVCMAILLGQAVFIVSAFYEERKQHLKKTSIWYMCVMFVAVSSLFFLNSPIFTFSTQPFKNFKNVLFFIHITYYLGILLYLMYRLGLNERVFKGEVLFQIRYLFAGFIGFASCEFIASYIFPLYGYSDTQLLSIAGSLFFAVGIVYAVLRYNVMDVHIILKRSTAYSIMVVVIVFVYLVTSVFFDWVAKYIISFNAIIYRVIAGSIIAFSYIPFRKHVEEFIDKLLFPKYYARTQSIRGFSLKLYSILNLRELIDVVVENMIDTFGTSCVALYLFDKKEKKFLLKGARGFNASMRHIEFSAKSALVQWFTTNKKIWIRARHQEEADKRGAKIIEEKMTLLKAELCMPVIFNAKLIGFLVLGAKENGEAYPREEISLIKTIEYEIAIRLTNALSYHEVKKNYLETVEALAKAVEAKDHTTSGHSERVQEIAVAIAKDLKCSRHQIELLKYAGMLHDIGKLSIDDSVLAKTDILSPEELAIVKMHPVMGEEIVTPIDFFDEIRDVIRHHHERWDGKGYPDQLKGKQISILCRILHVAESLDAMASHRSYRDAKTMDEAIKELRNGTGSQFDPVIIDSAEKVLRSFAKTS